MDDRLEQLRALLVRVERMPASAGRDWMLGEVRARAVDVETGVRPAAMRAQSENGAEPEMPAARNAARIDAAEAVPRPAQAQAGVPARGGARCEYERLGNGTPQCDRT
jgi:hypothetical protein